MPRIALGVLMGALGLIVLVAASYGLLEAESMSRSATEAASSPERWLTHWRTAIGAYAALGLLTVVGAVLVLSNRSAGLLLVGAAFAMGAAFPWINSTLVAPGYSFENPNAAESMLLAGCAMFCGLLFSQRSKIFPRSSR